MPDKRLQQIRANATFDRIQNGQWSLYGPGQGPISEKVGVSASQHPVGKIKNEICKTYSPINLDDIIGKGRFFASGYKVTKEHSFLTPCGGRYKCSFCAFSEKLLDAANNSLRDAKNPVSSRKTRIFMSSIKSGNPLKVETPISRLELRTKTKESSARPEIWMKASIPQVDIFCSPSKLSWPVPERWLMSWQR